MLSAVQKAAIRHLTPPEAERGMTNKMFAEKFNTTTRSLSRWEYDKGECYAEFQAELARARDAYQNNPHFFEEVARQHAMEKMLSGLEDSDKTHMRFCIKQLLKETEDIGVSDASSDYHDCSDAELMDIVMKRDGRDSNQIQELKEALKKVEGA